MFKMVYVFAMVLALVGVVVAGATCVERVGCRLRLRYKMPVDRLRRTWSGIFGFVTTVALMMTFAPEIVIMILAVISMLNWSPSMAVLVAIAVMAALFAVSYVLASSTFRLSKQLTYYVLRTQQRKCRVACRARQQAVFYDANSPAQVDPADQLGRAINRRKAMVEACPLLGERCPVGIERPLGMLDGEALLSLLEAAKPALAQQAEARHQASSKIVGISNDILSDLPASGTLPMVMTEVKFLPYYRHGQAIQCLRPERAEDFRAIMASFSPSQRDDAVS